MIPSLERITIVPAARGRTAPSMGAERPSIAENSRSIIASTCTFTQLVIGQSKHQALMTPFLAGKTDLPLSSTREYTTDCRLNRHGATAYQGWTKANAEFNVVYNPGNIGTFFWNNLNVGDYIPIRMGYGNYGGGASFIITILDPFGAVAFDSYTRNSPYIVRYSCDGTTAPPFSYAFGQEL